MTSAVIWNDFEQLRFFVADGDWSKFEGVYINMHDDENLVTTLYDLVYKADGVEFGDYYKVKFITIKEFEEAIKDGAIAVSCGFAP